MSGEVSIDRRLSPSGRFIRDATSGLHLPIGSGTTGLVWRGEFTAAPTDIGGSVPVNLPGCGGDWALPEGYRYDVETWLTIQSGLNAAPPTSQDLVVQVEGSTDNGSSWTELLLGADIPATVLYNLETRCYSFGAVTLGPLANALTNVRTRVCRVGTSKDTYAVDKTWTKIAQYVL
jgi:hypothetical protein